MSINATGDSYISDATFDAWMETKLNDAYTDMRKGMDVSTQRGDAQKALNEIKNQLLQMKTNGKDAHDVTAAMHAAIDKFSEAFPDVKKTLGEFADTLDRRGADAAAAAAAASAPHFDQYGCWVVPLTPVSPDPVKLDEKEIDNWTKAIGDTVDAFGKEDQLGLLSLNQLNSHINQTENIRSALSDSRNKTTDAIINRIG